MKEEEKMNQRRQEELNSRRQFVSVDLSMSIFCDELIFNI